ncbi:MAG: DUF4175 domain-containing protein [Planctomycetes bacterium]|nr:DUF4175 domain-containing protein [Planctomycetota bacterium]
MHSNALEHLCARFRRRLRSLLLRAGVARVAVVVLVMLPALFALDWWLHLTTVWRCLALLAFLGAVGAAAWWTLLSPLRRRWSDEEVFAYIDSAAPDRQGMLLELLQLAQREGIPELGSARGAEFAERAASDLAATVRQAEAWETVRGDVVRRWMKAAGAALALFLLAAVPLHQYFAIGCQRLFNPFSSRRWPHRTTITLHEPDTGWTIPQLEAFTVDATVTGVRPPQVLLAYRARGAGYWMREKLAVRDDGAVRYTFPEVREPIDFYVHGGDYTTDTQRIAIIARPYVKKITAHYDYPDYAGIPDRAVEGGQLVGLEGTKVRIAFESSMPLKGARFVLQGKAPEELPLSSETAFEKTLWLSADGSYTIELYERHGFREARPERYEIRVTPDNPPEVELLAPGRNLTSTSRASFQIAFRARDDFGLKRVEFLHQIDAGPPTPLTDRITGPLDPKGKALDARFTWDLRRMDLPKTGLVSYWVKVQDVNPTGRGTVETPKLQIKLVKPSEFHFETFEQAKRIEAEARVAWESQFAAWELGKLWPEKGTGKEDDPVWQELRDKQELAIRAAKAMEGYLHELAEQYEQNDMAREFMAGRLGVVTELLRRVTEKEHPAIESGLRQARPRTDADAATERLHQLRAAALAAFADNQKLALLHIEALVKRLFDWRDLQTTLIRSTLLHEEQGEVLDLTEKIAPKTLGWEIEDLTDAVQDRLLTLGKRQRTLFDVETELERELEFQLHRAELQQRRSILDPLRAAYKGLRENRVNDNLKLAARGIESNQAFQIVNNQKAALHVLSIVKGGLIQAGAKVEPEPPITLAMTPSKVIEVQPKPKVEPEATPETTEVAEGTEATPISPEELLANLPLGSDPVTMAVNVCWEAQDAVLARTRYLAENSAPAEMPRYVRLKQGILLETQGGALKAADLALAAADKATTGPVKQMLAGVKAEFQQSRELIQGMELSGGTQQLQNDSMRTLDDLRRRYIPIEKSVLDAAEENRRRDGADAFNRQYLIRGKDLEGVLGILADLNHAQLCQRDVVRKLARFAKTATGTVAATPLAKIEQANRATAAAEQKQAGELLASVAKRSSALSPEAAPRVQASGVGQLLGLKLAPAADEIQVGARDQALATPLQEAADLISQALTNLKDLLGERVKPALAQAGPEEKPKREITLQEWQKMRSPEVLRERLKADTRLPALVREAMLRALSKDFPPQYRDLLASYFASFLADKEEER